MPAKRPLRYESLESRRLLAADIVAAETEAVAVPIASTVESDGLVESIIGGSDLLRNIASEEILAPDFYYGLSHGPDLVQEVGNRLFVVDQHPYSSEGGVLFVFERTELTPNDTGVTEGHWTELAEVKVGVHVNRMIVQGDQVLLFGHDFEWPVLAQPAEGDERLDVAALGELEGGPEILPYPRFPKTVVVTVNLNDVANPIRQELPGYSHSIHHDDGRIVIVSAVGDDAAIAIYPPPPITGVVTSYTITPSGLQDPASAEIPLFGITVVEGDDLYVASTKPSDIVFLDAEQDPTLDATTETGDQPVPIVPPEFPPPPTVVVTRYSLVDGVKLVYSTEVGPGYLNHFEVAEGGQTGVLVRSEFGHEPKTWVDLLDLSDNTPTEPIAEITGDGPDRNIRFDSIELKGTHYQVLVGGPDYVVLRSWQDNTLVIIDANQQIDINSQGRVQPPVEIPEGLRVDHAFLQVTSDRLVLRAHRVPTWDDGTPGDDGTTGDDGRLVDELLALADPSLLEPSRLTIADVPGSTVLLTVSMSQSKVIAVTELPDGVKAVSYEQMFLIDSETQRFGFLVRQAEPVDPVLTDAGILVERPIRLSTHFMYGSLVKDGDNAGEFVPDGRIPVTQRWLEIDANAERLIVRLSDRLLEYDWDNPDDPKITPLHKITPVLEAVDDEYKLYSNGEDHLLHVLANDRIRPIASVPGVEIVELIGAPDGAEIVYGRFIRIPAEALKGVEQLQFDYVISNGEISSTATVSIKVHALDEQRIRELVQKVRLQAAEDFSVPVEDVEILSVERLFTRPLPIEVPGDPTHIDVLPTILVLVRVPDAKALYAATLEGDIIQVWVSRRETPWRDPLDTNGSGDVSASDALAVINFLGLYGSTSLENLADVVNAARGEGNPMNDQALAEMSRYDTDGSGTISPLDALLVINHMATQQVAAAVAEAEEDEKERVRLLQDVPIGIVE